MFNNNLRQAAFSYEHWLQVNSCAFAISRFQINDNIEDSDITNHLQFSLVLFAHRWLDLPAISRDWIMATARGTRKNVQSRLRKLRQSRRFEKVCGNLFVCLLYCNELQNTNTFIIMHITQFATCGKMGIGMFN